MSIKEDNYIKGHWKKKQTVGEANTSEEQAKFLVKKRVQGDRNFKSVAEIAQALCGPPFCCPSSSSYHARL